MTRWRLPAQRLVEATVLAQMLIFGVGALLIARAGELDEATLTLVFAAVVIGATAACSIILARRSRTIPYALLLLALMTMFSGGAVAAGIWGWNSPTAVVVRSLVPLTTIYLIASFDTGRPSTWADRRITVPALVVSAVLFIGVFLTSTRVPGGVVALQCGDLCQAGWMQVFDAPGAGEALARGYMVARSIAVIGMSVGIVMRLRTLRGTRRTEFAYLGVTALFWAAGVVAQAVVQFGDPWAVARLEALYAAQLGFRMLLPLSLLLGLMLAELRRGSTLEHEFARIRSAGSVREVRDDLRSLLEDPELEVVPAGTPVPVEMTERDLTELHDEGGRLVATVVHRDGLAADLPVPYAVAMPAATLALERLGLAQQMRELERDVTEARAAALTAGDAERARIERDLHDGAQARIVMLRARMNQLARDFRAGDDGVADDIAGLGADLDAVLQEVRSLSSGLRPMRLGTLVPSLRDYAATLPMPVGVNAGDLGTIPDDVELAVYFCIREALQNVAKHAGPGASASVGITRDGHSLRFVVDDDGVGIPPDGTALAGSGVQGMQARIMGVGGTLVVKPIPADGTRVAGEVPLQAGAPLLLDR